MMMRRLTLVAALPAAALAMGAQLRTGCAKCRALEVVARSAADRANLAFEDFKLTDIMEITKRGVIITLAIPIDGEVVCAGTSASEGQLDTMLKKRATDSSKP